MVARRVYHTATLLFDGRVLITGGVEQTASANLFDVHASAELFDPAIGKFTATGSISAPRFYHSATLLPDGRVLIAGGLGPLSGDRNTTINTAELFDPATGTFSATGSPVHLTGQTVATALADGRVLVLGTYFKTPGHPVAGAELYDPATGRFVETGALPDLRAGYASVLLPDGRVLVAGGILAKFRGTKVVSVKSIRSAKVYDPATGKFTSTADLRHVRTDGLGTLLRDGRVLITGGHSQHTDGWRMVRQAEIYDPKTKRFTETGVMLHGRNDSTATLLRNGRVLIAGGTVLESVTGRWSELYDPKTRRFRKTKSMVEAIDHATATLLLDGRVLIAGGYDEGVSITHAALYQP